MLSTCRNAASASWRLRGLLFVVLLGGPSQALAQEKLADSSEFIGKVSTHIKGCVSHNDSTLPMGTSLSLRFEADESGGLIGQVRLADTRRLDPSQRRVFRRTGLSLRACAPLPSVGQGIEVVFELGGETPIVRNVTRLSVPETKPPAPDTNDKSEQALELEPSGNADTEQALNLSKSDRRELQRRLLLIGFDPNGVDGIFGPGSRSAISGWQTAEKYEPTGFLNEHQVIALKSQTESAFQAWRASNPPKKFVKSKKVNGFTTVRGPNGQLRYRGADGCLRERPTNRRGAIILGISKYCNQRAFGLK